jgi:hypothetical protein
VVRRSGHLGCREGPLRPLAGPPSTAPPSRPPNARRGSPPAPPGTAARPRSTPSARRRASSITRDHRQPSAGTASTISRSHTGGCAPSGTRTPNPLISEPSMQSLPNSAPDMRLFASAQTCRDSLSAVLSLGFVSLECPGSADNGAEFANRDSRSISDRLLGFPLADSLADRCLPSLVGGPDVTVFECSDQFQVVQGSLGVAGLGLEVNPTPGRRRLPRDPGQSLRRAFRKADLGLRQAVPRRKPSRKPNVIGPSSWGP